jgi:hypothetical protein
MQRPGAARSDQFADLRLRVVGAAEDPGADDAGLYTRGGLPIADPIQTEPALVNYAALFVECAGLIGAGRHAVLAAHAKPWVDQHHTIVPGVGGLGRAYRCTGWGGTVLALNGKKPRRLLTAFLEYTDVALSLGQPVL